MRLTPKQHKVMEEDARVFFAGIPGEAKTYTWVHAYTAATERANEILVGALDFLESRAEGCDFGDKVACLHYIDTVRAEAKEALAKFLGDV